MFLFPENPLRERSVDEHFLPEARAARELGHGTATVSLEQLSRGVSPAELIRRLPRPPAEANTLLYRGWMLPPAHYRALADAIEKRGWRLVTTADQYERAHTIPGWHEALAPFTAAVVLATSGRAAVEEARARGWRAAIVRDHVKSLKHAWAEACHIPSLEDEAAFTVAARFETLRGDDLVGGIVLREFEQFSAVEARTWWRDGKCVLTTAHPDTPGELPPGVAGDGDAWLPEGLSEAAHMLSLGFCTLDLARTPTGEFRVVELGDGGVSDRPVSTSPDAWISAIDSCE